MRDRLGPGRGNLDAEDVGAELVWRAEVDVTGLARSLLDVPWLQFDAELSAKSFRSCPEAKWALRNVMVTGVSGVNFSKHLLERPR